MYGRSGFRLLVVIALVVGLAFLGIGAYNAGIAGALEERQKAGQVRLAVSDTGPGIPPEVLAHVFERFWKSPDSRGSGLGLAIARNLVEAHGGQIGADSRPAEGTTVWFTLPAGDRGS